MPQEYLDVVKLEKQKVLDVSKTPSAIIVDMTRQRGYKKFALEISENVSKEFRSFNIPEEVESKLKEQVTKSVIAEKELVESDNISLDEYINRYYESSKDCC
jgi:glutamate--cysteine ligase